MASRFRIPLRAQQLLAPVHPHPLPHLHPHQSPSCSRNLTLSASLRAKRTSRLAPLKPQPQQPPPPPSSSRSSPKPKAEPLITLFQTRRWPLVGAGVVALTAGLYISLVLSSSDDTPQCCTHHSPSQSLTPTGLPSSLDTSTPAKAALTATSFDKSLNLPESLMGLTTLRQTLASRARGHVLEVAVGTGRNLRFYDWSEIVSATSDDAEARAERSRERVRKMLRDGKGDVKRRLEAGEVAEGEVVSFTGVDVSGDMVGVARDRVREAVPGLEGVMSKKRVEGMPRLDADGKEVTVVEALGGRVRLVLGDAVRGLPAPPVVVERDPAMATTKADKYDTIVQTFGLCSVADPARLLANMASAVRPDTGRIVLLEHGRGDYEWMNRRVDKAAPAHFAKYGCWWNRDIEQLVRDAAAAVPGLEVVSLERPLWFQFGTTLLIELKVNSQKKA